MKPDRQTHRTALWRPRWNWLSSRQTHQAASTGAREAAVREANAWPRRRNLALAVEMKAESAV